MKTKPLRITRSERIRHEVSSETAKFEITYERGAGTGLITVTTINEEGTESGEVIEFDLAFLAAISREIDEAICCVAPEPLPEPDLEDEEYTEYEAGVVEEEQGTEEPQKHAGKKVGR